MNRTICFVPVRKGSKGIPGKNMRELAGKPLVCWILDSILNSHISADIWVATDCDDMEALIRRHYHEKVQVYRRSKESSQDTSPTIGVVLEFIDFIKPSPDDRFILLQATSPFTSSEEIQTLNKEMKKKDADSYIACCRLKKFRWSENGIPLDYHIGNKPRRQEYVGFLVESGAFYASTVKNIVTNKELVSGKVKIMELSDASLIDIDCEQDWLLAETLIEGRKEYVNIYNSKESFFR